MFKCMSVQHKEKTAEYTNTPILKFLKMPMPGPDVANAFAEAQHHYRDEVIPNIPSLRNTISLIAAAV